MKPTVGLLSRSGIIPISHSQDTAGPMARTVRDAAILLGATTGSDRQDIATKSARGHHHDDYTVFLDADGLKGARLGVVRSYFGQNAGVDRQLEAALEVLKSKGAILVDPVELSLATALSDAEQMVLLYEFKADLEAYLQQRGGPIRDLAALVAFNETHHEREMPFFDQELFLQAKAKGSLSDEAYQSALTLCRKLSRDEGIDVVMTKHSLDALIAPTGGLVWMTDWVNGDANVASCSSPAAVAGYPHITVPAGFVHGLPVGLSFFSRPWQEPTLLKLAYAFEQATKHRQPPRFLATIQL